MAARAAQVGLAALGVLCATTGTTARSLRAQWDDSNDETSSGSDPSWDHQTKEYCPSYKPATVSDGSISVKPFFSPDSSVSTYLEVIESAESGDTLYLGTPGWDSWYKCTYDNYDDDQGTCAGCYADEFYQESFPIFWALLNAIHNGVSVQIITNNYGSRTCVDNQITPLGYLQMNGAEVKYYASTTYWHAKFVYVVGKLVSISSVNFSRTSFLKNREAGMLIKGADAGPIFQFCEDVWKGDWSNGIPYVDDAHYSSTSKAIITNTTQQPVPATPAVDIPDHYVVPAQDYIDVSGDLTVYVSPDYAYDNLLDDISAAKSSFSLYIYQVESAPLCSALISAKQRGVDVSVMVSHCVVSGQSSSISCYKDLVSAGVTPTVAETDYSFSHQKYWIVDGEFMGLSTGNWNPTDFSPPTAKDGCYPVYGQTGWEDQNRDFNLRVTDKNVVSVFQNVLTEDASRGSAWDGSWGFSCPYSVNTAGNSTVTDDLFGADGHFSDGWSS